MEQLFTIKGDANMENTKKYNRKQILDITVMALILAIRLVMEMLPAIKFGVYVQLGFGFI